MIDKELQRLRKDIIEHPSNAWAKERGYEPVYAASKSSKIVIIGQAPGRKAQESHVPWNDVSGDTLREWLDLTKEDFYDKDIVALVPMDFYFPGKGKSGDLPPRKDFAPLWHPRLFELMPNIQLMLIIGQYAQQYYLGTSMKRNLTETVRAYQEYLPEFVPLAHPSPLNRRWNAKNPWFEAEVIPATRKIVHQLLEYDVQ